MLVALWKKCAWSTTHQKSFQLNFPIKISYSGVLIYGERKYDYPISEKQWTRHFYFQTENFLRGEDEATEKSGQNDRLFSFCIKMLSWRFFVVKTGLESKNVSALFNPEVWMMKASFTNENQQKLYTLTRNIFPPFCFVNFTRKYALWVFQKRGSTISTNHPRSR